MTDRVEAWTDGLEEDAQAFAERWRALADGADEPAKSPDPSPSAPADAEISDEQDPVPLAVVERDLPVGLFGFTRRGSDHVTVNKRLYKVDRERTIRHEKTHHRHPKDELTIRYINGDIDVENTLSFQASARMGRPRRPRRTAAYGSRDAYTGDDPDRNAVYDHRDDAIL